MKKLLLLAIAFVTLSTTVAVAQRRMETLDRGLVAVKVSGGVYVSWRIPGDEWFGVTYNIYRDGTKLNDEPLEVSNFTDAAGATSSSYQVAAVVGGVEQAKCAAVTPWGQQYKRLKLVDVVSPKTGRKMNDAFSPNDISVADLDGDGEYELIVKRENNDFSVGNDTAFTRFEAYKLNGTLLWVIDMGPNMINFNNVETDCMAYDFDGDGKAEVVLRATDSSVMPDGTTFKSSIRPSVKERVVRNIQASPSTMYQQNNDEWLVLLDGETGKTLDYEIFDSNGGGVAAGNNLDRRETGGRDFYYPGGKGYGHRANKFHFGAPWLDGVHPSIYLGRGCYTNMHACTWDVVAGSGKGSGSQKKLQRRWVFATDNTSDPWFGQGFHNFAIVDVDNDGRDEICHGNMVLDEFGHRLSSTGLGHGDAQHYSDFDPFRKGKEGFRCLEDHPGAVYVDAATNEMLIHWRRGTDNGRCLAGNFSDRWPGAQLWTVDNKLWSASLSRSETHIINGGDGNGITMNGRIYWDGDLLEESYDYATRDGYEGLGFSIRKAGVGEVFKVGSECHTNNSTKGNPGIQADLFGDWREEFILRESNNEYIRIYTTVNPTPWRNYSLMYDHDYRNGVYWQMNGYNQPPHTSYFLGEREGITLPPPPLCTNGKTEVTTSLTSATDGQFVYIGQSNAPVTTSYEKFLGTHDFEKEVQTVSVGGTVKPAAIQVFAFQNVALAGGTLDGDMHVEKLGLQDLKLDGGTYSYTGATTIWFGSLTTNANLPASHLVLRRFAELNSAATFGAGITAEHGAVLHPAGDGAVGTLTTTRLELQGATVLAVDIYSDGTSFDVVQADSIIIEPYKFNDSQSRLSLDYSPIVRFNVIGGGELVAGDYVVAHATQGIRGDISGMTIEGLEGLGGKVYIDGNDVVVRIKAKRATASVVWSGAASSVWDFNESANFVNGGDADVFVTGDDVLFDATASTYTVNVAEAVYPASVTFDGDKSYRLEGDYPIAGEGRLVKQGSGTLSIDTRNTYSGGTQLLGGTTEFSTLADAQSGGAFGYGSLYVGAGAVLKPTAAFTNTRSFSVGRGAVIDNALAFTQTVAVDGREVSKVTPRTVKVDVEDADGNIVKVDDTVYDTTYVTTGYLIKRGNGALTFSDYNVLKKLVVEAGTVNLPAEYVGRTAIGDTLEMRGGQVVQTNSSYAYQNSQPVWYVPEGANATITGACRMEQRNKLVGKGTLTFDQKIVSSCPRFYQYGDWREFEGTLVAKASGDGTTFMIHNTLGMPKATLNISAGTTVQLGGNVNGSAGNVLGTFRIGSLTGTGTLSPGVSSSSIYEVGSRDEDFTFGGIVEATLRKVGSGAMTMTGNTGAGTITIAQGSLLVNNRSSQTTTTTGTARLAVTSGATLTGRYYVGNNTVTIQTGASLVPGLYNSGSLTFDGSLICQDGSTVELTIRKSTVSGITVNGAQCRLAGKVKVAMANYTPQVGDEFELIKVAKVLNVVETATLELPELPDGMEWDASEFWQKGSRLRIVASADGITSVGSDADAVVTVYAAGGQQVAEFRTTADNAAAEVTKSDLPRGIYILRVASPSGVSTRKFIKR